MRRGPSGSTSTVMPRLPAASHSMNRNWSACSFRSATSPSMGSTRALPSLQAIFRQPRSAIRRRARFTCSVQT
ncbi:MAG: hypothetical protein A2177_12215 [Spirochaetes bacterium RBG_13_68_11]|nr:MAG: hypothetical protein A2177_12215 [Spirochaetes bacterium RBG_13_68_11]